MNHPLSTPPPPAAPPQPLAKSHPLPGGALLPPPELPGPNAEEVARFQCLFLSRFGVQLSEEEAHDQARRLVQFVFLMQHALPYLDAAHAEHEKDEHEKDEHGT